MIARLHLRLFGLLLALLPLTEAAAAVSRATVEKSFAAWLQNDLWPEASAAGVSKATFGRAFAGVTLDWDIPEIAPPGTEAQIHVQHQAEFRAPAAYFREENLATLARTGREKLKIWAGPLGKIEKRFGVPGGILVAIWARETGFGAAKLPRLAIRSLATLAFMGWRKETFRPEIVAALQILEAGDISPAEMRSSWAGAVGQPQFLPSQFRLYAIDFDGDGKRDIWNSVPDTLASIANYLAKQGWKRERGWGVEASVPASVSCALEGPEQGQPMRAWAGLGVTQINGKPLPGADSDREAFLMMPAGRFGPAFMVSQNFYTLKLYNNSDLYALFIGHLADRLGGSASFAADWGKMPGGFNRAEVKAMQARLVKQGSDVGEVDGLVGFKTRIAVGRVQEKRGEAPTCWPDAALVRGK
ncbi:MAG: lytic murein transglycosylase [Bauldia sp.]